MLVFEENTAFILAFFDKHIFLQLLPLQIIDAMVAYFETFLAATVCINDARFVIRLAFVAYNIRQIQRQCVNVCSKECSVLLV